MGKSGHEKQACLDPSFDGEDDRRDPSASPARAVIGDLIGGDVGTRFEVVHRPSEILDELDPVFLGGPGFVPCVNRQIDLGIAPLKGPFIDRQKKCVSTSDQMGTHHQLSLSMPRDSLEG